jgi:hypothetical protein
MIAYEIKKSRQINENEINDLVNKAVTFNFDFITKPNETLTNFIFQDSEDRNSEDLLKLLDYPYYYNFLRQILISYVEKKQLLIVKKQEFEFLLNKVDSELFYAKANELVDNALEAMVDFFNIGAVIRSQVPPQAVELFLQEKKLGDYSSRLQNALTQSPKTKYEIDEIKKIIYTDVPTIEQKRDQEKTISEEKSEKKKHIDISKDLNPEIKTVVKEDLTSEQPMSPKNEAMKQNEVEVTSSKPDEINDLTNKAILKEDVETFPIDKEKVEKSAPSKSKEVDAKTLKAKKDIISFLTDREIEKIISSIFYEDKEDFTITIETLNGCKSFEKATEILKSLYTTYNVNPYSRDAILLTNAVAKFFNVQ